jgi:hypothetical protein
MIISVSIKPEYDKLVRRAVAKKKGRVDCSYEQAQEAIEQEIKVFIEDIVMEYVKNSPKSSA